MKCPAPSWWSPYINRVPNERFFELFTSADKRPYKLRECCTPCSGPGYKLYYRDLPWEGHDSVEVLNAYDENRYIHQLEVTLYEGGPRSGRVRSMDERHDKIFHTSSDWRDHACTEQYYHVRPPTDKEVAEYTKILNETTTSDIDLVAVDLLIARSAAEDSFRWGCGVIGDEISGPDYHSLGTDCFDYSVGPYYDLSGTIDTSLIQQAYQHLEVLLSGYSLFDYVDLKEFYAGMNFEGLKKAMLDRFIQDCANCLELMGISKSAWSAMIKVRLDEYFRGKFKRSVNDERNRMSSECFRCREAAGGGGHLYFFDRKRSCLGCVAQNGKVFDANGKLLGSIADNGEVFDAASNIVARLGKNYGGETIQYVVEECEYERSYFWDSRSGCWFYGKGCYILEGICNERMYAGFAREILRQSFEYKRQAQEVDWRFGAIPLFMKK